MCYPRGLNSQSRLSILLTWSPNVSKHLCIDFKHHVVGAFTELFFIPRVFPHCPVHHSMEKDFSSGVKSVDGPPMSYLTHPLAMILRDEFSSLEPDGQRSTAHLCRLIRGDRFLKTHPSLKKKKKSPKISLHHPLSKPANSHLITVICYFINTNRPFPSTVLLWVWNIVRFLI